MNTPEYVDPDHVPDLTSADLRASRVSPVGVAGGRCASVRATDITTNLKTIR